VLTLISSNELGEPSGASNVFTNLFQSTTSPVVIDNIGVTLLPDGTIVLPNGNYELAYGLLASNSNCQIASGAVAVGGVNSYTIVNDLFQSYAKDSTGYYSYYTIYGPSLWSTVLNGNNIYFTAEITQSTPPATLVGCLKITQLSTAVSFRQVERKYDSESTYRSKVRGFIRPSIVVTDEEYISVSPQTAAISISSARNDVLLSMSDFST